MLCTPKPNGQWSLSLLNGYFIGNIPYFQTNPYKMIEMIEIYCWGNTKMLAHF